MTSAGSKQRELDADRLVMAGQGSAALDRCLRGSEFQQYLRESFWCKEERLESVSPHRRFATGIHGPAVVRFELFLSDVHQVDAKIMEQRDVTIFQLEMDGAVEVQRLSPQ